MVSIPLIAETNPVLELLAYIEREVIRRKGVLITPETPLVSSGLIDSFALVEIFLKLEELTRRKIPAGKVQARDMDTVELMFRTAERIGKPRP
jgi:acyl carrier protein